MGRTLAITKALLAITILCVFAPASGVCAEGGDQKEKPVNLINVSWGDQIMIGTGDAKLDTPEKISRAFEQWKTFYDGDIVLWRSSDYMLRNNFERRATGGFPQSAMLVTDLIWERFDPIAYAIRSAHRNQQTILAYLTIYDEGAPRSVLYGGNTPFPWQSHFVIENPQYQTVDRAGNPHYGVLELAYPEARAYLIETYVDFVNEYGFDGLYLDLRTHSMPAEHGDQFGFSRPIVEEFKSRYGVDIMTEEFDKEAWRRLRGEYLVQFYRELRAALPGKLLYLAIPMGQYIGPPYGNMYLDWESIVSERLIDGLVIHVWSGRGLYPNITEPHESIGYLSSEDDKLGVPDRLTAISEVYGPVTKKNNVDLYYHSGSYGFVEREWFKAEPLLDGFMIYTPSGEQIESGVPHHQALSFPDGCMTIEAFVYPTELGDHYPRIISKYGHAQDSDRGWELQLGPDGRLHFRVELQKESRVLVSNSSIPVGQWTHVVAVFDLPRAQMRVFINGELDAQREIPNQPLRENPSIGVQFGRYGGANVLHFNGFIDEVRFVAEAPLAVSVPTVPYTGNESNTVALYHFDEICNGRFLGDVTGEHDAEIISSSSTEEWLVPSMPGFGRALRLAPPK